MSDNCYGFLCFTQLDSNAPKFFGFSEFLAGLALMMLAWMIADIRYRFRVGTAPFPLQTVTFGIVVAVGALTLLTDLWRAEQWWVPQGNILTPASWQALLGGLFLLTFLTWAWFAFINPPKFSKNNAKRYAQTLYRFILKGSPTELAIIADELSYSAKSLVCHATDRGRFKDSPRKGDEELPIGEAYANSILLLIADKRFCRSVVETSPGTALAIFSEMKESEKYGIQVETFAKNIVAEALANKDSFLFHEAEGYESGLIGYHKPLSHAMFGNYNMVEAIETLLDPALVQDKWDEDQWKSYCRMVLMTFENYVNEGCPGHSYTLYRAFGYIEHSMTDLYMLNGNSTYAWDKDQSARLRVITNFINSAVEVLGKNGVPEHLSLRARKDHTGKSFYDYLSNMIFEIIFAASAVHHPTDLCWQIQHNSVWSKLFNSESLNGDAGKVIKFKVRRLLYDEVVEMKEFPNFKGAKILGFCLNVMGLEVSDADYKRGSRALQRATLSWTKKNYAWLHSYNPRVAESCLVDGITYDEERQQLVKTYPVEGLRREPCYVYLDLDSPPADKKTT